MSQITAKVIFGGDTAKKKLLEVPPAANTNSMRAAIQKQVPDHKNVTPGAQEPRIGISGCGASEFENNGNGNLNCFTSTKDAGMTMKGEAKF